MIGIGDGQHNDFELGIVLQKLTRSVQAVEGWHANVEDDNIRLQLLGHFDRLAAIGGFPAHFPALMFLEKRTQAPANNFVVIG